MMFSPLKLQKKIGVSRHFFFARNFFLVKEKDYIRQSTKISFLLCENIPTSISLTYYAFLWLAVCQKKCHGVFGFSESRGGGKTSLYDG